MNALLRIAAALACAVPILAAAAPFAYVPLAGDGVLQVIDLADNRVVNSVRTGTLPIGVAVSPSGHRVYVTNNGPAQVEVFDTATLGRVAAIPVPAGPYSLAMHPNGTRLYVTSTGDASVTVIDTTANTVLDTIRLNTYPLDTLIDASGASLYITAPDANAVGVIETATFRLVRSIPVSRQPGPMALTPSGILFIGDLQRQGVGNTIDAIDVESGRLIANISVGNFPNALALSPDARRLYVANRNSDTVSVVDVAGMSEVATIAVGDRPWSLDVHPDGSRLYVVNNWSEHVSVVDTSTLRVVAEVKVGPNGAAVGRFVGPAAAGSMPGPLSGMWWNPDESGWGLHLTQRRDVIFAAWFTYDDEGLPIWFVASDCRMATAPGNEPSCSGGIFYASGSRFFGTAFDPTRVTTSRVGTLTLGFPAAGGAVMTYNLDGLSQRTVRLSRQVGPGDPLPPAASLTDLWWNPAEAGWGLAVHEQRASLFLAWFVYDATGDATWYVASNCVKNSANTGCTGAVYRATGPAFGPAFDPTLVKLVEVGTASLAFNGTDNAVLSYTVDGTSGTKAVTRQRF